MADPPRIEFIADPAMTNIEAEAALLGALMIENRLIDNVADIIRAEDFAEALHGRIYEALLREHDLGRDANPVTLRPYFEADPVIEQVGGAGYLAKLTGSGAALIGAMDFARQVADLGRRRRFAEGLGFLVRAAEDYGIPVEQLAADSEAVITAALGTSEATSSSASAAMGEALGPMHEPQPSGVSCGIIPSLDHALGTIRPGWLVILGGRPGMGKTATALSYAHGAAQNGHGTLFVSLEMRAADLGARLASDVAFASGQGVPYDRIVNGGASPDQCRQVARAVSLAEQWPLWIEDLPGATLGQLAAAVRRNARRFKARGEALELVIVDYLQMLQPNDKARDLYQAITAISRGLKALAKAEAVGIMAVCQLSRKVEDSKDRKPRMEHLRDSGQIEQDADAICFVFRDAAYMLADQPREAGPKWDEWRAQYDEEKGRIEFIVAKRRFGQPGNGSGLWHGEFQAVRG